MINETYYIYVDTQATLKRMNELTNSEYKNQEIIKAFDIVLQLILLIISFDDKTVDQYEMQFIDKITLDDDILVKLSNKLNRKITWFDLTKLTKTNRLNEFIKSLEVIFSDEIDFFITFISKTDGFTDIDYSTIIFNNIKKICEALAVVDGNTSDLACIDNAINEVFFNKYLSLKKMVK